MSHTAASSRRRLAADLSLLAITAVWGVTFVTVKNAVAAYPVFPFLMLRFLIAALALAPAAWWARGRFRPGDLPAGIAAGFLLFTGYALQTLGLQETEAAKAGFITGLSVVLVPVIMAVLWRQLPPQRAIAGTALATVGLALLSLNADWSIHRGDLLVLGCAFGFAGHIVALSILSPGRDPRVLTLVQVATVTVLSAGASLVSGGVPAVPAPVLEAAAFTGVVATALAFFVQTAAQRLTPATHTALILTAEPVFAALFGVAIAGERLVARGWLGCVSILVGVILGALAGEAGSAPKPADAAPIMQEEAS